MHNAIVQREANNARLWHTPRFARTGCTAIPRFDRHRRDTPRARHAFSPRPLWRTPLLPNTHTVRGQMLHDACHQGCLQVYPPFVAPATLAPTLHQGCLQLHAPPGSSNFLLSRYFETTFLPSFLVTFVFYLSFAFLYLLAFSIWCLGNKAIVVQSAKAESESGNYLIPLGSQSPN